MEYGHFFKPFYREMYLGCSMIQRNSHIISNSKVFFYVIWMSIVKLVIKRKYQIIRECINAENR